MVGQSSKELITEASIRAIYEMLTKIYPFNTWKLPSSRKIKFVVDHKIDLLGQMHMKPFKMVIGTKHQEHFITVVTTIAHEMVHLKLYLDKDPSYNVHRKSFREKAEIIGELFGFDRKAL
jgi:hypothetical protein